MIIEAKVEITIGKKLYLHEVKDFDLDEGVYEIAVIGSAKALGYVDWEAWEETEKTVFVTLAYVGGDLCDTRTLPLNLLATFL